MNTVRSASNLNLSPAQIRISEFLVKGDYAQMVAACEAAIAEQPEVLSHYWYLGLGYLLQEQEAEAQMAWMTPIMEAESEDQQAEWIAELVAILAQETERQESLPNVRLAWLLRQHIRDLAPTQLANLLRIPGLGIQAETFSIEDGLLDQLCEIVEADPSTLAAVPAEFLNATNWLIHRYPAHAKTWRFLEVCTDHLPDHTIWIDWADQMMLAAGNCYVASVRHISARFARLALAMRPDQFSMCLKAINYLQHDNGDSLVESISVANHAIAIAKTPMEKVLAVNALLSSWIASGGNWQKALELNADYKAALQFVVEDWHQRNDETKARSPQMQESNQLDNELLHQPNAEDAYAYSAVGLVAIGAPILYFEDRPDTFRPLRHQLADIAQKDLRSRLPDNVQRYQQRVSSMFQTTPPPVPRIGYFSGCFHKHSIGWLSRWLLQHHDRDRFDVHLYTARQVGDAIQQQFINQYGNNFHTVSSAIPEIADQIYNDKIDLLIELDSLTSFGGCGVVALKPAPVQVNWLGYDSSGVEAVDYFIADPYVLSDSAQEYYRETIWRLPDVYLAVDGFEVYAPTMRRSDFEIPDDAVVYLSSQTAMKRNADNVRLQLRILKAVPNSYFLIKSFRSHSDNIVNFFYALADEEGVSRDRLKFLPDFPSSFIHRANLGLADIVLDTYPYNGATTSMEALWVNLPIVTQVGEQFAARNTYTMLKNVGVEAGIAWSPEEYIEWGIRLGMDEDLRNQVVWTLKKSKHTSPLWNAKKFTLEMENAYQQMWQRFLDSRA